MDRDKVKWNEVTVAERRQRDARFDWIESELRLVLRLRLRWRLRLRL